jgi:sulfatase maturation enzyme AslB (radical SAM superfamily)
MQYYNSDQMQQLRQQLLDGEKPLHCDTCYYEESFGKLNGRIRQLNKSAVDVNNFDLTLRSSPHYNNFKYSLDNNGLANLEPVDLQIELGNKCNSACIMCNPEASSRLEPDYKKLHKINAELFAQPATYTSWTRDHNNVKRFVEQISSIKNLRYVHFLGGETLYEEAFYAICDRLIDSGKAPNIIIGTTTNGTIYNDNIKKYVQNFQQFHLGISIESVTDLNDYVRWPGKIDSILPNIDKFLQLRDTCPELFVSLRITPNVFTVWEIDKLFTYMIENQVIAESCNILHKPDCLRIELLPEDIRKEIVTKIQNLIDYYELDKQDVVNIRRSDTINQVIANVVLDYYHFLCDYETPDNIEQSRYQLIEFVKAFESIRNNSILHHVPRYEKFLRLYGY